MLRTKIAKKVLTKAEQKHLTRDAGIHTMEAMKRQVAFCKKHGSGTCFDCEHIASKLGLF